MTFLVKLNLSCISKHTPPIGHLHLNKNISQREIRLVPRAYVPKLYFPPVPQPPPPRALRSLPADPSSSVLSPAPSSSQAPNRNQAMHLKCLKSSDGFPSFMENNSEYLLWSPRPSLIRSSHVTDEVPAAWPLAPGPGCLSLGQGNFFSLRALGTCLCLLRRIFSTLRG